MKKCTRQIAHLEKLLENAQNPKIVWEEMQLLGAHAFDLQDEIMHILDDAESTETDIASVQNLFETREYVWDLMNQIALLEARLKEKTFPDGKGEKQYAAAQKEKKHTCCCGHQKSAHTCGCSHHEGEEHTGCSAPKNKKEGCCKQRAGKKSSSSCCHKKSK